MNEQFALESLRSAEGTLNKTMDTVGSIFMDTLRGRPVDQESISTEIAKGVARVSRISYALAEDELEEGIRKYGEKRSFAMGNGFASSVSQFYSQYIPVISRHLSAQTMNSIMGRIREGEIDKMSANEIADEIARDFQMPKGRVMNITRTEGTRAASLSRRSVAYRAKANGRGPSFFVYKTLLDGRGTKTCLAWNNRYWSFDDDRIEYHPPHHFYCRSGVIFSWNADEVSNLRPLDKRALTHIYSVQNGEFPHWEDSSQDMMTDMDASVREAIRSAQRGRIYDYSLNRPTQQGLDWANKRIKQIQNAERKAFGDIKKYADKINKNTGLKQTIQRELERERIGAKKVR